MRKNLVWIALSLNLVCVAVVALWVILKPVEIRALVSLGPELPEILMASTAEALPDPVVLADAGDADSDGPPPRQAGADSGPPPRQAGGPPPPRRTGAGPGGRELPEVITTPRGAYLRQLPETAPAPELYPMRVDRRVFPSEDEIEVQLSILNASGGIWSDAVIVLKAPNYPDAVGFALDSWRLDEIAVVKYRFPRSELRRRMEKLRVVAVVGTQMASAVGEGMQRAREEAVRQFGSGENVSELLNTGETQVKLMVPEGFTGVPDLPAAVAELGEDQARLAEMLTNAQEDAAAVERDVRELVAIVNEKGFAEAMEGEGGEIRRRVATRKKRLDEAGIRLALTLNRSQDPAAAELRTFLGELSDQVFVLVEAVEGQARLGDPEFSLSEP